MQRRRAKYGRKADLSRRDSARALIIRLPVDGSGAQDGTSPHRNAPSRRPAPVAATASTSSVGATFQRGPRSSATTSSTSNQAATSRNGVVEVYRPHIPLDRTARGEDRIGPNRPD